MKECAKRCEELNVSCPCGDCRLWIDHEEDLNWFEPIIRSFGLIKN